VLDGGVELVGEYWVVADRRQRQRLLEWAAPFTPRVWAVDGATGTGALRQGIALLVPAASSAGRRAGRS
jgi:hypothetical protein